MNSEKKAHSGLRRFLFFIILPIMFLIILAFTLLSIFDIKILDKVKDIGASIPIISKYVEQEPDDGEMIIYLEQQVDELQKEIEQLENELERKDEEVAKLEIEQAKTEQNQVVERELASRKNNEYVETAKTYEAMQPKSAAAIISELSNDEAMKHLEHVSIEVRAKILAKMESDKAAQLMSRLAAE